MADHDYDIANSDGATVRADINSALDAVNSMNSGASEPAAKVAGSWWYDTGNSVVKQRNSDNTAWISRFSITTASDYNYMRQSYVDQPSTSGAVTALKIDQADVDDTFIDFIGTENGTTGSIKTGVSAHGGTTKAIKIELNGSTYYLLASTAPA